MNLVSAFTVAYRALVANMARSMLTTLGIIIGVAAVITMVALTNGAKQIIEGQLVSLGGNSLIINSGQRARSGVFLHSSGSRDTLTPRDARLIKDLSVITYASPIIDTAEQVVWGNRSWFTAIIGVAPDFANINDWFPERGTFIIADDVKEASLVCVIGTTAANELFGIVNPIGKSIRIGQKSYTVLGVLSSKGQTPGGKDQDDVILIPYTTYLRYLRRVSNIEDIAVSVKTADDLPIATEQITELLRDAHNIPPGMPDDFYIKNQQHVTERIFSISKIMTILLASIASVSLIVGGIGIMNIMLVSVTERTKEIGIRIAVGARENDIRTQFLIEAVLLSLIGGVIGIVIGVAGSELSSLLTGWPTVISIPSVIISFSFSAFVGIFFGLYPAIKASKLDPIEALRYE